MKQRIKKYNLTPSEFAKMVFEQHNSCAICGQKANGTSLAIDHCHKTGRTRQLLCINCNTGLGKFKDDPKLLYSAIEYLKKHNYEGETE